MKLIEQLRKQLEQIGATLDDSSDYTLNCDAPSGYVWAANHCHSYAIHYATNSESWLAQAIREEMPSLKMGLLKITDPEEIKAARWDLDDDTWGAPADAPDKIPWGGLKHQTTGTESSAVNS